MSEKVTAMMLDDPDFKVVPQLEGTLSASVDAPVSSTLVDWVGWLVGLVFGCRVSE